MLTPVRFRKGERSTIQIHLGIETFLAGKRRSSGKHQVLRAGSAARERGGEQQRVLAGTNFSVRLYAPLRELNSR